MDSLAALTAVCLHSVIINLVLLNMDTALLKIYACECEVWDTM
jgi:hypothetical protein